MSLFSKMYVGVQRQRTLTRRDPIKVTTPQIPMEVKNSATTKRKINSFSITSSSASNNHRKR